MAGRVYDQIRDAIIRTELKPGAWVSEAELAETFATSRTPIREAFKRLADEGLIEVAPQSGTRISRVSVKRMRQAIFLRATIESAAVRTRETTPTVTQIQALDDSIRQQKRAVAANDIGLMHRHDMAFHQTVMTAFGQPLAWTACAFVCADIARIQFLAGPQKSHLLDVVREHRDILKAIKDNNTDAAADALQAHVRNVAFDQSVLVDQSASYFDMS